MLKVTNFLTVESQKRLVLEMHPPAEDQALDKQFNHICKSMQVCETSYSLQFSVSRTTTKFPCIVSCIVYNNFIVISINAFFSKQESGTKASF